MRVKRAAWRHNSGAWRFAVVAAFLAGAAPTRAELDPRLRDALASSSPKVRIVAIATAAASGERQARILLESMLDDENAAVRAALVAGLGRIEDPASITALERLTTDADPTVQEVLKRVLPALKALRTPFYLGHVEDYSARASPMTANLKALTTRALEKRLKQWVVLHDDPAVTGLGAAPLAVRSVGKRRADGNTFIEVRCELTLVEMPGKVLRAALSSTASVGVEGDTDADLEEELTEEALGACAPELADEVGSFIESRRRASAKP